MAYADPVRHGNLYRCGLFFISSCEGYNAIFDYAILRKIISLRARGPVNLRKILITISEQGRANGCRVSDESDAIGAAMMDVTPFNDYPPVIIIYKDAVSTQLVELTICQRTVFSTIVKYCPSPVGCPVAA